jgi:hypothetical protein
MNALLFAPTKQALDVVRHILTASKQPLSTKEIFNLAVQAPVPVVKSYRHISGPEPPHPEHPIRSIR